MAQGMEPVEVFYRFTPLRQASSMLALKWFSIVAVLP